VNEMSASEFNKLWKAIDILEAQEHIAFVRAIQYPHLKKQARVERDKKLYQAAYPRDIYKKDAKSVSFLVQKLGGAKNG
jgi:hypothetical protein